MAYRELRIGLIGYNFMGKAHSQAWLNAPRYFDLAARPILKVVCGRSKERVREFAYRWGWEEFETDWRSVVDRDDIDVLDIATPTAWHHDMAVAAAEAGKHVFCEKPISLNIAEAESMLGAAQQAGVTHYLNHNYRRCPAVRLAKRLIEEGHLGRIYHWRGAYLQSWIVDPEFPLTWQLQAGSAGAGPQFDLNSHSIDLARYLVGNIIKVCAMSAQFIEERPLPSATSAAFHGSKEGDATGLVTVEDAASMIVRFENGAMGSFEASRFAPGRLNYNEFEIYGSQGAIQFNLERMNELQYLDSSDPQYAQGFRTVLVTEPQHEYISAWWPPGHTIGYEHQFTHAVVDFVDAVVNQKLIEPNFEDGLKCMRVLIAGLEAANSGVTQDITL